MTFGLCDCPMLGVAIREAIAKTLVLNEGVVRRDCGVIDPIENIGWDVNQRIKA